jgi:hypothetical protein
MPALCFPNPDALRLALAAGIIPPELARGPVRGTEDEHGRLWAEVPQEFPREVLPALARIGVTLHGPGTAPPVRELTLWAELLPLRPDPAAATRGPVLIEVPDGSLARLTAEVRRVRPQPMAVRLLPDPGRAWLLVSEVPTFTAYGLHNAGVAEVFFEQAPRVWVSAGWQHPLAGYLAAPDGMTVLIRPGRGWQFVPGEAPRADPGDFVLPRRTLTFNPASRPATSLPVGMSLRSAPGANGPELLWILPGDPAGQIAALARDADEQALRQFRAAVLLGTGSDVRTAVLADEGQTHPPILVPSVRGFTPHTVLPNLYLPIGTRITPEVRDHTLYQLLGLRPDLIAWVEPRHSGEFVVHRVPAVAFRPFLSWVGYHAPAAVPLAVRWTPSDLLAAPRFSAKPEQSAVPADHNRPLPVTALPPVTAPPGMADGQGWLSRIKGRLLGRRSGPVRKTVARRKPRTDEGSPGRVGEKLSSPNALVLGNEWSVRQVALERRVLTELPRSSPDERAGVWAELAEVYTAAGNPSDAAVCWLNAVWDRTLQSPTWLGRWLRSEARAAKIVGDGLDLDAVLRSPSPAQAARVAAAHLTWAAAQPAPPPDLLLRVPRVLTLLDVHEPDLPVRSVWLARSAAARLTDGDPLGLARCRDRVFRRLTDQGPGLDLDAPSFLRFSGAAGDRWFSARDWLARVRDPVHRWLGRMAGPGRRLQWAGIDPNLTSTAAYADLILAWGLSRLGDRARARDLEVHAGMVLERAGGIGVDPAVHRILRATFAERIRAAQDGRPDRPGLPLDAAAELARLDDLGRYAVDKLRAHCGVLEPVDLVNPYRGRDLGGFLGSDRLGERLARLLARPDLAPEPAEVESLLAEVKGDSTAATLPRVVFALLEVAPRLDPAAVAEVIPLAARAVELVPEWVRICGLGVDSATAVNRFGARLMVASAHAAALFHLPESFRLLIAEVLSAADSPDATAAQAVGLTAGRFFRTLRRLGLGASAADLPAVLGEGSTAGPRELGLAVGWFAVGNEDAGNRVLNAARDRLFVVGISDDRERTATAIAYAAAVGHAPPRVALGRLEELFQRLGAVSLHGATNRYYTLKPLELIDTVVRAVVSDDFALGPEVRGWLDDDEYLIRRRITRDLEAALGENLK